MSSRDFRHEHAGLSLDTCAFRVVDVINELSDRSRASLYLTPNRPLTTSESDHQPGQQATDSQRQPAALHHLQRITNEEAQVNEPENGDN